MVRRDMGLLKQAIIVRNYESRFDRERVEDLERQCEVGSAETVFLFTDTLGDPVCRIRNSPMYNMLVAELNNELVGVIRGSIKLVTVNKPPKNKAKVGYVLGLRVSPHHRRKGVASSLVREVEKWFIANGVEYSYMATQKNNQASLELFIGSLGYKRFRTPAILLNPVQNHPSHVSSSVRISKLAIDQAHLLYRKYFTETAEFFPQDIDAVLRNKLSLGTWVAHPKEELWNFGDKTFPTSWAMLSVWNTGEVFKLWLGKAPLSCMIYVKSCRVMRKFFPFLNLMPDFFNPFGFYFVYGIYCQGSDSGKMVRALCKFVHNIAVASKDHRCKVIVTEIGSRDEVRHHVPHWKLLSCPEDLWCIKSFRGDGTVCDEWTKTLFVDPREV